jgi:hypothetical protein
VVGSIGYRKWFSVVSGHRMVLSAGIHCSPKCVCRGFASKVVRHSKRALPPVVRMWLCPSVHRPFLAWAVPFSWILLSFRASGVAAKRRTTSNGRAKPHPHNRRQSRFASAARLLRQSHSQFTIHDSRFTIYELSVSLLLLCNLRNLWIRLSNGYQ